MKTPTRREFIVGASALAVGLIPSAITAKPHEARITEEWLLAKGAVKERDGKYRLDIFTFKEDWDFDVGPSDSKDGRDAYFKTGYWVATLDVMRLYPLTGEGNVQAVLDAYENDLVEEQRRNEPRNARMYAERMKRA